MKKTQKSESVHKRKRRWSKLLEGQQVDDRELLAAFAVAFAAIVYMVLRYGPHILRTLGGG